MSTKTEVKSVTENIPETDSPKKNNNNEKSGLKWLKWLLIILLIIVVAFSATVWGVVKYVENYDTAFPNVYISDIPVEGMTENEILSKLDAKYSTEKIAGQSIPFVCNDSSDELKIDDLDVHYLNNDTAAKAFESGRNSNIVLRALSFMQHFVSKTVIEPSIAYNNDVLSAKIDSVTAPHEKEPVGYTYKLEPGKVTVINKEKGIKADRNLIVSDVESQIRSMAFNTINMVPVEVEPAPVNIDEVYNWMTSDPQDAYYEKGDDNKVYVQQEKLKCTFDKSALRSAISNVGDAPEGFVAFDAQTEEPENTKTKLEENLYKDLLGSYKTGLSGTAARVNNIMLATSRVNGTELMPDEEFSYDKAILPRNYANGYQAAPVYVGNKVASGLGGGICQGSSTLYCAALYANLGIVERHNHSMAVGYVYPGMDATISEGVLDLKLKNTTGYPVKLVGEISNGMVNFSIYGYNPENISVDIVRGIGGGAYLVTRVVKKDGVEIKREEMPSSRYSPHAKD